MLNKKHPFGTHVKKVLKIKKNKAWISNKFTANLFVLLNWQKWKMINNNKLITNQQI